MIDTPEGFARRLDAAAEQIDDSAEEWAEHWGHETAERMRSTAPRLTGALAASIRQVEPGGIEIGVDYWPYVERGTADTAPQPFIGPAISAIRDNALGDALERGLDI